MSETQNGSGVQSEGIIAKVEGAVEHLVEEVKELIHPASTANAGNAAAAPAAPTSVDTSGAIPCATSVSSSTGADIGEEAGSATMGEQSSSLTSGALGSGDVGNVAAVAGTDGASASSVSGAPAAGGIAEQGDAGNANAVGAATSSPAAPSVTALAAVSTGAAADSSQSSVLTPQTSGATDDAGSGAHVTLLRRWYQELSKIGRGLSAETERLLSDTKNYLDM